ncbi:hypothetical protein CRYUN_Cryun06bG0126900 [Craigia yunnanensis]
MESIFLQISHDIVEDILVQGDRMRDTLQELQDAVYLTKMHNSTHPRPESLRSQLSDDFSRDRLTDRLETSGVLLSLSTIDKDLEMPMPSLALAPLQEHGISFTPHSHTFILNSPFSGRPCNVSDVLTDLVDAAPSNLIEGALLPTQVGGKVDIISISAPAGGALLIIDDDGLDMHYMTQMHSLAPFGAELFSENMIEDNMTWNFVAGLTVACEILESYGCVVRVISPRSHDAALGAGGTRVEL